MSHETMAQLCEAARVRLQDKARQAALRLNEEIRKQKLQRDLESFFASQQPTVKAITA